MGRFDDVNAEARRLAAIVPHADRRPPGAVTAYRVARRRGLDWLCPDCGTTLATASLAPPHVRLLGGRGMRQDDEGAWDSPGRGRGRKRGTWKRGALVLDTRYTAVRADQPVLVHCWNCPTGTAFRCEYDAAAIEQENVASVRRLVRALRRHVEGGRA